LFNISDWTRGTWSGINCTSEDKQAGGKEILVPIVCCITGEEEVTHFLYPNNFNSNHFTKKNILAGNNEEVDNWNQVR